MWSFIPFLDVVLQGLSNHLRSLTFPGRRSLRLHFFTGKVTLVRCFGAFVRMRSKLITGEIVCGSLSFCL
jgi:hypothetical protein